MKQAIVTKYIGPTNFRGARVKAKAFAGTVTISWDDALGIDDNHTLAATTLANKFGWLTNGASLAGGGLPTNDGNCYVIVEVTK